MKTSKATGKYAVSFNCSFGDYCCGEDSAYSLDYAGDDIEALAQEVCADDPNYPLTFKLLNNERVVGIFHETDDEENVVAVMVPYAYI